MIFIIKTNEKKILSNSMKDIKQKKKCSCLKTAGLLELTGPFSDEDNALKKTFDFYWANSKKWGLKFKPFPIFNTNGEISKNIEYLEKLYAQGYRIFVGFSRSTIVAGVFEWFNKHPDAIGISATSTAYSLVVKKNIYRMTPIDKGTQVNLEKDIAANPSLSVYFMYEEGDFFSTDYLKSYQANPIIAPRLIVCTFKGKITPEELSFYLVNSKKTDFIVNGLANIDFLSVFDTPNFTVNPYIYDGIGSSRPNFTVIQSQNLKGDYSYFSYQGINTSYLWRTGLKELTQNNFAPQGFDILQVQTQLVRKYNPDYLEGASGILQFDPITKERIYYSVTREDFNINQIWSLNTLIFDDPFYGQFITTSFSFPVTKNLRPNNNTEIIKRKCPLKTAALFDLTGSTPYSIVEINLKYTFEYYWQNCKRYGLSFSSFPIYDIGGDSKKIITCLDKLYKCGFRIFIGFATSTQVKEVLPWFKSHPDAYGISPSSTSYGLAIEKNIYRMEPVDNGPDNPISVSLETGIKNNPLLSVYYLHEVADVYSNDFLKSLQQNPIIGPRLIVCDFTTKISPEQLSAYLVGSKTTDFLVNGLVSLDFLGVFNTPNYTINPYIYDNAGTKIPTFTPTQSQNLKGNYSFYAYQGINTAYLWRKGFEDLGEKYAANGFDILQVQTQLARYQNPDYLEGAHGVLQFDPITKDRLFYSFTEEDYLENQTWKISELIFQDPLYGTFIANKI